MSALQKENATVAVNQDDLRERIRDYHLAMGASIAGFIVEDLTLNVRLTVDGEEIFADFELIVSNRLPVIEMIVLKVMMSGANHWYVLSYSSTTGMYVAGQYRLVSTDENSYLEVDTFRTGTN